MVFFQRVTLTLIQISSNSHAERPFSIALHLMLGESFEIDRCVSETLINRKGKV